MMPFPMLLKIDPKPVWYPISLNVLNDEEMNWEISLVCNNSSLDILIKIHFHRK